MKMRVRVEVHAPLRWTGSDDTTVLRPSKTSWSNWTWLRLIAGALDERGGYRRVELPDDRRHAGHPPESACTMNTGVVGPSASPSVTRS
jgi:hypothetical protein